MRTSCAVSPALTNSSDFSSNNRKSGRKFNVDSLPADIYRVYECMSKDFGEEYALTLVFLIRTAVELHRAWHMTLLTDRLLQQIKKRFDLRTTWNLGVTDLIFRVEDGLYELHRRVPYDYDSEFQNICEKTAVALIEGDIGIHDALIFQSEMKTGKYTCKSGLFLRRTPGRLVLYPFQAATCCVVFFQGDWYDAGIAALCGITAGLIEWALSSKRVFTNVNDSKMLLDFFIGVSTGGIGGLFFRYFSEHVCLNAIFLGTLYWFFYGTAFVIGLLEIIAGELQTGVTRFLAVSVKTFVLSVGSAVGLTLVIQGDVHNVWTNQFEPESGICNTLDLGSRWWRLPLYILCSVSVLGQYRFTVINYWAGLIVQVAAHEAQYQVFLAYDNQHKDDGMDTVFADLSGAVACVLASSLVCLATDYLKRYSKQDVFEEVPACGKLSTGEMLTRKLYNYCVSLSSFFGLGRGLSRRTVEVLNKLEKQALAERKPKSEVRLPDEDEATLVEAAVEAQETNVWAFLMPAVYQLVPGSKLAQYWYTVIFQSNQSSSGLSPESALWLTSVSLALGLILGLTIVRCTSFLIFMAVSPIRKISTTEQEMLKMKNAMTRQYKRTGVTRRSSDDDPSDNNLAAESEILHGTRNLRVSNEEGSQSICSSTSDNDWAAEFSNCCGTSNRNISNEEGSQSIPSSKKTEEV
mmetsp:Transcript_29264/g.79178  ORF Transcript_29264/g.79178 Transcript_29264/m.79178 type:complete len:690 (+) Transcript_29264:138-2207(+)|eukprot:CAMPEP_0172371216 /NCGR_PEP_ID=MMETSP1060-20121228/41728_1 /TAXON_ID=37318 /ORGANISM="Pseudo-nitzschia pungens, Strain cf. cingulata" /LENGTH=689 /DNA_ID=CAMNT_0013096763 /DNA_START=59 /DNA_END=2128 /DNA_ORIENTATION=-